MKKIYKKFLGFLFSVPVKIENTKTYFFEWFAIIRKAPLYKHIKWTKEQQKEFDTFWKNNYGKKISNRWHKLYESMNGVYRFDYIPEIIFTTKIEPNFNNFYYGKILSDKSLLDTFYNNRVPGVRTPKTLLTNNFGVFYDSNRKIISEKVAIEILSDIGNAVIKPTIESSSGSGIKILNISNGINILDNTSLKNILKQYKTNYIIQEKIKPHKELKDIYSSSINTVRITSYILDSEVHVAPIALRIGSGGSFVDNIHAGGIGISVDNLGYLNKYAYKLGYGDSKEKLLKHPDSNVVFENYYLGFIDKLINTAKQLHGITPNIGVISWDFTVDECGDIIIVEINLKGQGVWFPQTISGKSLFGENAARFLNQFTQNKTI